MKTDGMCLGSWGLLSCHDLLIKVLAVSFPHFVLAVCSLGFAKGATVHMSFLSSDGWRLFTAQFSGCPCDSPFSDPLKKS